MKTIKLFIFLFINAISFAQVGINTTTPTNDLDVNGGVRVRNLQEGTVESQPNGDLIFAPYKVYAFVVIDKPGTILKQYGISSVTNIATGKYRITFSTPMIDNDYIILGMGKNRNLSYDTVSSNYVEITVSSTSGNFDFNIIIIDII
ncbi:hypothetical protein LXD69_10245 [Flavobacterium sediminilitoris]|uniref:Uncharacterized protein n=1 Tax=Flavobacterium sediminilitoris TaxID=2024526 RepID=A0ABY4HJA9_9FLAO|nr:MULTISPECIES: hypothetical protein [Flavobacterium]UOX32432.1 hypothetical protein LXD69_10245 [Flavobacterium sediminilitoris]